MGQKSKNKKNQSKNTPRKVAASAPVLTAAPQESLLTAAYTPKAKATNFSDQMQLATADIRRIFILLGIVIVVLIGLTIFNAKSTALTQAGQKAASFMGL